MRIPSLMTSHPITIDGEHETANGWLYTLTLTHKDNSTSHHEITLSWVDHEHLVAGTIAPSHVAKAAAIIALRHFSPDSLPERFDFSALRRRIPDLDNMIRDSINAPL